MEVKFSTRSFTGPESQIVGSGRVIAWDRDIVGDGLDDFTPLPDGNRLTVRIRGLPNMAEELNLYLISCASIMIRCCVTYINCNIMSRELPGIKVKPVVRHLDLIPIDNFLLENTISVSKTITPGGVVKRGQTVKETSSQSAKATVAQRSIVLLSNDILNSESELGKTSLILVSAREEDV